MARNQSSEFKRILDGNKIFNKKSLTKNALEYLASGKGFIMDRLRLDILTKIFRRIFNENPCSPCVPWIKKIRGIRVQIFLKPDRLDLWCIE